MDDHELAADIAREAGELLLELQARQATKDEGDRLSNDEGAVEAWRKLLSLDPADKQAQEAAS